MADTLPVERLPDPRVESSSSQKARDGFWHRTATRVTLAAALLAGEAPSSYAQTPLKKPAAEETVQQKPGTIHEYWRQQYGMDVVEYVQKQVKDLDDPDYFIREDGLKALATLQRETGYFSPQGGFDAWTYFRLHEKNLTLEQQLRLRWVASLKENNAAEPVIMPPISWKGGQLLQTLEICGNGELSVRLSPEAREKLDKATVEIAERCTLWETLEQVCTQEGLRIALTPQGVELTDDAKTPAMTYLGSNGKTALFLHPVDPKEPQHVSVAFEPGAGQGKFLHPEKAIVLAGPVNRFVMGPPAGQDRLVDIHKKTYAPSPEPATDAWNLVKGWSSETVAVKIWFTQATRPGRKTLPVQAGESFQYGLQSTTVESVQQDGDVWHVTVNMNAWLDKSWNSTPYTEDRSRYLLGGNARLTFRTGAGKEIPCEECDVSMNQAALKRTFTLAQKPETVDIAMHGMFRRPDPVIIAFPAEKIRRERVGEYGTPPPQTDEAPPTTDYDECDT